MLYLVFLTVKFNLDVCLGHVGDNAERFAFRDAGNFTNINNSTAAMSASEYQHQHPPSHLTSGLFGKKALKQHHAEDSKSRHPPHLFMINMRLLPSGFCQAGGILPT